MHGGTLRGNVIKTCHFEKKISAIILCHYLKNGTYSLVSLTRKVQSHKVDRHILVGKDLDPHIISSLYK